MSRLLTVDEAVALILDRAQPLPPQRVPLNHALRLTLAEPILADIDLPPFDKATMDGYAARSADLETAGETRLRIVAEVYAGQVVDRPIGPGEAARIMTGAPLPPGADAVVPVERSRIAPDDPAAVVLDLAAAVRGGRFVLARGREMRQGDRLMGPGSTITPAMLGLIAAAGRAKVDVTPRPSVTVVPTGDELVPVDRVPGPGQIRNSNGPMLAALARAWGGTDVIEAAAIPDQAESLKRCFAEALVDRDVLIISGGVSAGLADLVPAALVAAGVEAVFHKVAVKPGKPIWFGVGPPRSGGRPATLVFGLPGNPASTVVGFLLFVRPALDALAGRGARPAAVEPATLGERFDHRGDRPTFHPARWSDGRVFPLPWAGSADLRTVALADGFAAFPAGDRDHEAGAAVGFLRMS